jgi:uracil-DNA glycosylase
MQVIKTNIEKSWKKVLQKEFNSDYFINIKSTLINEQKNFTIYPPSKDIFKAFNTTPFDDVKVVIIGQDPYHGIGQAHGLSFSVQDGIKFPPSLENIFKELKTDLNIPYPANGNLTSWAKQGVLLLNASLTVRESDPNSHQNIGWQKFTDSVIQQLSEKREGIIFLLWGGFAKKKGAKIDRKKHHILTTGHPSPLSANRGYWFGNKHFSKTNKLLISMGKNPIDWNVK